MFGNRRTSILVFTPNLLSMIRKCIGSDFESILEIVNEAARKYDGVIPKDRYHTPYMPADELEKEIASGVVFYGYYSDGLLSGVMGIQDVSDVTLIRHAYVKPEMQGRGIGSELLEHLLTLTDKKVLVGTWADATWAVRFYEKFGFEKTSRKETEKLLKKYWRIPERQIETSVVLTR